MNAHQAVAEKSGFLLNWVRPSGPQLRVLILKSLEVRLFARQQHFQGVPLAIISAVLQLLSESLDILPRDELRTAALLKPEPHGK